MKERVRKRERRKKIINLIETKRVKGKEREDKEEKE